MFLPRIIRPACATHKLSKLDIIVRILPNKKIWLLRKLIPSEHTAANIGKSFFSTNYSSTAPNKFSLTTTEMKSFLQIVNFYHKIPNNLPFAYLIIISTKLWVDCFFRIIVTSVQSVKKCVQQEAKKGGPRFQRKIFT